jgi:hypothetical protein
MKPRDELKEAFPTEAALCAAFAAWARADGMTVYAETDSWDLLCVTQDGHQLGVEAKLSLNLKVIEQVLRSQQVYSREQRGPDFRAVLVPESSEAGERILAYLGVAIFVPRHDYHSRRVGDQVLWRFERVDGFGYEMFDFNPAERCELPDYVPDVAAGVPAPRTLSPWKVGALRVLALLEVKGFVTRAEVAQCRNDARRWCASDGYLESAGGGRWAHCSKTPRFDEQHPTIYAQILAETREAQPKPGDLFGAAA